MNHARLGRILRVILLPLLLVLLTALVLGCHYETNDDYVITLLLRGRTAAAPVADLHLYFHGWDALLAALYRHWPAVPWYGLVLYALLTGALMLLFAVADELLAQQVRSGWARAGWLTLFFLGCGLEHVQWFNYMRVPLLLAGAVVLLTARRAPLQPRWLLVAAVGFAAAWAIRPSAAVLGAAVAAPGAVWLAGRSAWRVVAVVALVAAAGAAYLLLSRTPAEQAYRRLDVLKSDLNDYHLLRPQPRTASDSLGVAAVQQWALGDTALVNEALFERAIPFDTAYFWQHTAPHKLAAALRQLPRDYFLPLLFNVVLLVLGLQHRRTRTAWWLVSLLAMAGLLLALAVLLKLPPRLALPLLTLITVANGAWVLQTPLRPWPAAWRVAGQVVLGLVIGLYGRKVWHRAQVLRQEEATHAAVLETIQQQVAGKVLVSAGIDENFKSLSPFSRYDAPTNGPWLLLTGWTTLDPSQPALRQRLTGTRAQPEALRRLSNRADVYWLLPTTGPEAAFWRRYFRQRIGREMPPNGARRPGRD